MLTAAGCTKENGKWVCKWINICEAVCGFELFHDFLEAYTTLSLPVALHGAEKYSVRQLAVIYCNITPYRVLTESKCSGVTVQEFSDRRYTGLDYPAVAALTKQTLLGCQRLNLRSTVARRICSTAPTPTKFHWFCLEANGRHKQSGLSLQLLQQGQGSCAERVNTARSKLRKHQSHSDLITRQPPGWIHNCLFNKCACLSSVSRLKTLCIIGSVFHSQQTEIFKVLLDCTHTQKKCDYTARCLWFLVCGSCVSTLLHSRLLYNSKYWFVMHGTCKEQNMEQDKLEGAQTGYYMNYKCVVLPCQHLPLCIWERWGGRKT